MERSRELEQLTLGLYSAVSNADPAFFERHLSRSESCTVIGTAPDEWWDAYAPALRSIREQMKVAGQSVDLRAGELRAYREGAVGWVTDRPTFRLGTSEVACRHTSVFVKESDEWRIVQHHFSIGVPNEEVFGKEAGKLGRAT
jgi:hypothetical protein